MAGSQTRSGDTRYIFPAQAWRPAVVARLARMLAVQISPV